MAKLPAAMIRRKKRPRKQLPAATSAANSCTQTDTLPPIYRRTRPPQSYLFILKKKLLKSCHFRILN
jgi:hypothetical protein